MSIMGTNEIHKKEIPFRAVHPTEIIRGELKARSMTGRQFAEKMGMKPSNLSRMLKGENITLQLARKLEDALDIPADYWMRLQDQYDRDVRCISENKANKKGEQTSIAPEIWEQIMECTAADVRMSSIIGSLKQMAVKYGIDAASVIRRYRYESEKCLSDTLAGQTLK